MQSRLAYALVLRYSNKYCASTPTAPQHGEWLEAIDCKNEMMYHNLLRTGVMCQKGFVMRDPRHFHSTRPTTGSAARFEVRGKTQRCTRAQLLRIRCRSTARASVKGRMRPMQNRWVLQTDALALGCVGELQLVYVAVAAHSGRKPKWRGTLKTLCTRLDVLEVEEQW